MNRQMKRMQERQEKRSRGTVAERREAASTSARRAAAPSSKAEGKKRTGVRQFLKEVRQELRKVAWPTRRELVSYTIVVLVTVVVMTSFVFGLDFVFTKLIFNVLTG
jgi:preprotein translocase subunit SecE